MENNFKEGNVVAFIEVDDDNLLQYPSVITHVCILINVTEEDLKSEDGINTDETGLHLFSGYAHDTKSILNSKHYGKIEGSLKYYIDNNIHLTKVANSINHLKLKDIIKLLK